MTRWGAVLCTPDDRRVVKKQVCYSELSALRRGRHWKKRFPDHVVRFGSLLPRDTSVWEEVEAPQ